MAQGMVWLGTSGWSYTDWLGTLYPPGTPPARFLGAYATQFPSVEIDSSFYATPRVDVIKGWRERTPDPFVFAAKVPRSITHDQELVGVVDQVLAFADAMRFLEAKCGPLLFQFAPSFDRITHWEDMETLLPQLPTDLRWAVEVRHRSWFTHTFYDLLRAHNVALVHADAPRLPRNTPTTANFAYIRWLGDRTAITEDFSHVHAGFERKNDLDWWAERMKNMTAQGLDVFAYANNHYQGHSPATLRAIQQRLGLPVSQPPAMPQQQSLF
jgi:uncharacterized protein YecE (DUF72 family)